MISTNDFRTGVTIELDGEVYSVVEFQHVKPGKGSAFVRTRIRNLKTGNVLEKTFNAGEKLPRAHVDRREVQYLYNTGDQYIFMDNETYEQLTLTKEQLGDAIYYMTENMVMWLLMFQGASIGVELPNFVVLKIVETDPGFKGDTATGGSKPARMETGLVVKVPFFIENGQAIKVDTRTGQYIERA
ncbi:MAG: elongation factor P [Firmicutes bacterium]|nr:elongation factor P [Bacillota bacterium]